MSVVLEEEREINRRWLLIIVLSLSLVVLMVFAFWSGFLEVPDFDHECEWCEDREPIEPHMSPAIMAKSILGVK